MADQKPMLEIASQLFEHKAQARGYIVMPRLLSISGGDDELCWKWIGEVPILLQTRSLEVSGSFQMSKLTTGKAYNILFLVKRMEENEGWESPVAFRVDLPDGSSASLDVVLKDQPDDLLVMVFVGRFEAWETDEEIKFSMTQKGDELKKGLLIKGIMIRPAYD